MGRIRPLAARATALVVVSGMALVSLLTSAAPASAATPTCRGTSLVLLKFTADLKGRVPTVGNGTPNQFDCILAPGDNSTAVARLQIDLNDCYGQHLTVDGDYGPATTAAVKFVQAGYTTPDGIYGPLTIDGFDYQLAGFPPGNCDPISGA